MWESRGKFRGDPCAISKPAEALFDGIILTSSEGWYGFKAFDSFWWREAGKTVKRVTAISPSKNVWGMVWVDGSSLFSRRWKTCYVPEPSILGAKCFRYRVSIQHPLGLFWHSLEGAGIHIWSIWSHPHSKNNNWTPSFFNRDTLDHSWSIFQTAPFTFIVLVSIQCIRTLPPSFQKRDKQPPLNRLLFLILLLLSINYYGRQPYWWISLHVISSKYIGLHTETDYWPWKMMLGKPSFPFLVNFQGRFKPSNHETPGE